MERPPSPPKNNNKRPLDDIGHILVMGDRIKEEILANRRLTAEVRRQDLELDRMLNGAVEFMQNDLYNLLDLQEVDLTMAALDEFSVERAARYRRVLDAVQRAFPMAHGVRTDEYSFQMALNHAIILLLEKYGKYKKA